MENAKLTREKVNYSDEDKEKYSYTMDDWFSEIRRTD